MSDRDGIPEEFHEAYDHALALADSPELYAAFAELAREPEAFAKAAESDGGALRERGIDVPETLSVSLFEGKPNPLDWEPFRIVLTRCRTFKRKSGTGIQEVTICLGISIQPNPPSPIA